MRVSRPIRGHSARRGTPGTAGRPPPAARALVVGEERHLQRWASGRLAQAGFDVEVLADGLEALASARRDPPDLIILDHVVQGVDARYLLYQLRRDEHTAHAAILVFAADAATALRQVCRDLDVLLLVTGIRQRGTHLRVLWPPPPAPRTRALLEETLR